MKNLKPITVLLCLLMASQSVKSQENCGTPAPAPPSCFFSPGLRSSQTTASSYTLRIFVHILRSSNGSGGVDANAANTILSRLNTDFTGSGIQFLLAGYDFINNNTYSVANLNSSLVSSLFATNSHNNAIDIYVLHQLTTNITGQAQSIPATAYIIANDRCNSSTVTHEMGHCLGLYHTHHGTVTEYAANGTNPDPSQCPELVNGSNSSTCGDYITDTPADPRFWNNCNYNGGANVKDANNHTYNPNPANYMAYSLHTCRNMFAPAHRWLNRPEKKKI